MWIEVWVSFKRIIVLLSCSEYSGECPGWDSLGLGVKNTSLAVLMSVLGSPSGSNSTIYQCLCWVLCSEILFSGSIVSAEICVLICQQFRPQMKNTPSLFIKYLFIKLSGWDNNNTCHWWESQSCSTWARLVKDCGRSRSLTECDPSSSMFWVRIQCLSHMCPIQIKRCMLSLMD